MTAADTIAQFRTWAHSYPPLLVLDTETTALDGEIIEIAAATMDGTVLLNQRVRPVQPVSAGAFAVHGISTADLADCPTFDLVWPCVRRLISQHDVLVYNKGFDFARIDDSLTDAVPGWFKNPDPATRDPMTGDPYSADYWLLAQAAKCAQCVMEAFAPLRGWWSEWHGSYRWAKLTEACEYMGVDLSDLTAHSALGDVMATIRLVKACAAADPTGFPWIGQESVGA